MKWIYTHRPAIVVDAVVFGGFASIVLSISNDPEAAADAARKHLQAIAPAEREPCPLLFVNINHNDGSHATL
jgi:hypothetical protein